MDPRIQAGIIAFSAAIIATGITGFINYKMEEWKDKKSKIDENQRNINLKKEELIKRLYILQSKLSFNKIEMHTNVSQVESFNKNFDEVNILIAEVMMILSLYFPKYKKEFIPIREKSSIYWKSYKDYLESMHKTSVGAENPFFSKSLSNSSECQAITQGIINQL
jgi:hypothetical protein